MHRRYIYIDRLFVNQNKSIDNIIDEIVPNCEKIKLSANINIFDDMDTLLRLDPAGEMLE